MPVVAFDVFCGAGGVTYGLRRAGIRVAVGVDKEEDCRLAYTQNNPSAKFLCKDIRKLSASTLLSHGASVSGDDFLLLAACAPCQPFREPTAGGTSPGGWLIPKPLCGDPNAAVVRLDLSARARNVFIRLNIKTVKQLLNFPKHKLFKAQNFGRKSLAEVQVKLCEYLSGKGAAHSLAQSTEAGTRVFVDHLLTVLSERQRGVVQDRYGLWDGVAETLQDVGDKMGVTRERIRQIQAKALHRIRQICDRRAIEHFVRVKLGRYLKDNEQAKCGVLNEDECLVGLADDCSEEQVPLALAFLQDIWPQEQSVLAECLSEIEEGVFCLEKKENRDYREILELVVGALEKRQKPLRQRLLFSDLSAQLEGLGVPNPSKLLQRVLAISPSLALLQDGTVALSRWSEFGRRNTSALAEAALRVIGGPAHFTDIARKIVELFPKLEVSGENAIHSALIRRQDKFVWVKNGTYGLKAWGLQKPPFVKDRLVQLLSEVRYPLPLWHLKEKVLEVCNCKEESVRMTLDLNPRVFKKFEGDQYGLLEHFQAQ